MDWFFSEWIEIGEEIDLSSEKNAAMEDHYVDTSLEDWFQRFLEQAASPPVEVQDDSMIMDLGCLEDIDWPLDVPPDSPVPPTDSNPPNTVAPPIYSAPPPTPALPPCFIPAITHAPPTCSVRPRTPSPPRPHIKKPPNSFMVFRMEQRPHVVAQHNVTDCAAVNKILGQMWKSLSETEKEKYHRQQREESDRHYELHPAWTPNKTGVKRKSDSQTGTGEPKKRRKKWKEPQQTVHKTDEDENQIIQMEVRIPSKGFSAFYGEQRQHLDSQYSEQFGLPRDIAEQMWDSLTVEQKDIFVRLGHGLAVRKDENVKTS